MSQPRDESILHWCDLQESTCGYCKSEKSSISHGMWAETLSVDTYQSMLDRGWRRSGKYCYKPLMSSTCCPQYTIRCSALVFQPTKSHKKLLKKLQRFITNGQGNLPEEKASTSVEMVEKPHCRGAKVVRKGLGADLSKPQAKKAKVLRQEHRRTVKEQIVQKNWDICAFFEQLSEKTGKKHVFTTKLLDLRDEEWTPRVQLEEFELYKKYQVGVHGDAPEKCTLEGFQRFLVKSPLQKKDIFGTYHEQYFLDERLVAVGVVDILPKCLSSVYFFYDPLFSPLTLGTLGSLREISHVQRLHVSAPSLEYYYMGYFISTCPKMAYKGRLSPSALLCPETYTWVGFEGCLPLLEGGKYSRLQLDEGMSDDGVVNEQDLLRVKMIDSMRVARFGDWGAKRRASSRDVVALIGRLLGRRVLGECYIAGVD